MAHLLVVEDDADVRSAMVSFLEAEGHQVSEAATGEVALEVAGREPLDMVLLDLRLPGLSGLDVCRILRRDSIVPIIIVSAYGDNSDLVAGLEAGADDYIVKPMVPDVLAARVRALLRRCDLDRAESRTLTYRTGEVEIRVGEGRALKGGEPVALTKKEFGLLCTFAEHANQVLSRD